MKKYAYMTPLVFVAASLHLLISTPIQAENFLIEKLDLDEDGQITIKEAVANPAILASFGKIDTDGNGKISSTELAKSKITLKEKPAEDKSE